MQSIPETSGTRPRDQPGGGKLREQARLLPALRRILSIDLAVLQRGDTARVESWQGPVEPAGLDRLASWSGSALSVALLLERANLDPTAPAPLVISVGECVRRGTPTAARASVASRAPLTGLYSEGQVGSDLARRLASFADAVVISGRCDVPGALLQIEPGAVRLLSSPELAGLDPKRTHEAIERRIGPCATLVIGPAGERELPCASLAAFSSRESGDAVPHFVGRGGLGAVLGRTGLKAVAVSAPSVAHSSDLDLIRLLLGSDRLANRSQGGTFELIEAYAARGDLRSRNDSEAVTPGVARAQATGFEAARSQRRGCTGCPTPCGWVFDGRTGHPQGARFGASHALGLNLGLERFEDALALLAACDAAGLDAKELGAGLALLCEASERGVLGDVGGAAWGKLELLLAWIDDALRGEGRGARLAHGSARLACELGLESRAHTVKGSAVRPEKNLAALLGQCVSARGSDPMRSFPFLAADGSGRERLRELLAPLELPPGIEDPANPAGKGRLVWWHENLSAALDMSGFCAFSAGAILADGTCSLDRLAKSIAPAALAMESGFEAAPGARLLAAGEELVLAVRALNRLWGWTEELDRPKWARDRLEDPGMLPEYRALRSAAETPGAERRVPTSDRSERRERKPDEAERPRTLRAGRVTLACSGTLANALGAEELGLELALPATVLEILEHATHRCPRAARSLVDGTRVVPAIYRAGKSLRPQDLVSDGDRLDLLLVISGG